MAQAPVDETPLPSSSFLATTDSRYRGYARQALGPTWESLPNPLDTLRKEQQRREAEAARLRAMAAAQASVLRQQPNALFNAQVPGASPSVYSTQGPVAAPEPVSSPDWLIPGGAGADALGRPARSSIEGVSRVDTRGAVKGPEKRGYAQEAVYDEQGRVVGWQYVQIPGTDQVLPGTEPQTPAEKAVPRGAVDPNEKPGDSWITDLGRSYPEAGIQGKTWQEAEGEIVSNYARVQRQVYGEPTMETVGNNTFPVYDTSMVQYYGIDSDSQARGLLPQPRKPPALPKNATNEQKMAYQAALMNMFAVPLYKVGDSSNHLLNLDRQQTIKLQKDLKNAGFLKSTDFVVPGSIGMTEIQALQNAMGEANVRGLTLDQTLAMFKSQINDYKSRQSSGGGGGGGGGGEITRQVNIQFNQTSIAQGRSLLARILEDAMGRPPSDSELAQYMQRLNAAEKKSPTRTVTNYVKSGNTQTSTSRTKPTSVDPESMAREFAMEINGGQEMLDMQSNSYLDGLMQMLMGAQNG